MNEPAEGGPAPKATGFFRRLTEISSNTYKIIVAVIAIATALVITFRAEFKTLVYGPASMTFVGVADNHRELVVDITNNGRDAVLVREFTIAAPELKGILDFGRLSAAVGQQQNVLYGTQPMQLAISRIDALSGQNPQAAPDEFFNKYGDRRVEISAKVIKINGKRVPIHIHCSASMIDLRPWVLQRVTTEAWGSH